MQYPSYENYRDVDYVWSSKVPEHWQDKRFRFLLLDGYEGLKIGPFGSQIKSEELTSEGYKIYGQENVINNNFSLGHRFLDEEKFNELSVYEISPGDLLITMMGTSGKCRIAPDDMEQGIMDSHLIRLRSTDEILTKYSRYLIDESRYIKCQIDLLGKGSIMHGLNSSVIKSLLFHVPPVEEQKKIIKFLDYKTQQIDQLIEKKKALIEKLEEKRIAVITQAVTKGLDKNAKLKPSGVDWLGDVPEHWVVEKLKFHIDVKGGGTPNTDRHEYWNGDIPWVSPKDMKAEIISETEDYITKIGLENSTTSLVDKGTVLIVVRSGILRHSIPVAINSVDVSLNQDMKALKVAKYSLASGFLMAFIYGLQEHLLISWSKPGCTVESIESEWMMNTLITLPPIDEQALLVSYIEKEKRRIDKMNSRVTLAIKNLEEYRSVIITSAVTGKIDLRKVKIPKEAA